MEDAPRERKRRRETESGPDERGPTKQPKKDTDRKAWDLCHGMVSGQIDANSLGADGNERVRALARSQRLDPSDLSAEDICERVISWAAPAYRGSAPATETPEDVLATARTCAAADGGIRPSSPEAVELRRIGEILGLWRGRDYDTSDELCELVGARMLRRRAFIEALGADPNGYAPLRSIAAQAFGWHAGIDYSGRDDLCKRLVGRAAVFPVRELPDELAAEVLRHLDAPRDVVAAALAARPTGLSLSRLAAERARLLRFGRAFPEDYPIKCYRSFFAAICADDVYSVDRACRLRLVDPNQPLAGTATGDTPFNDLGVLRFVDVEHPKDDRRSRYSWMYVNELMALKDILLWRFPVALAALVRSVRCFVALLERGADAHPSVIALLNLVLSRGPRTERDAMAGALLPRLPTTAIGRIDRNPLTQLRYVQLSNLSGLIVAGKGDKAERVVDGCVLLAETMLSRYPALPDVRSLPADSDFDCVYDIPDRRQFLMLTERQAVDFLRRHPQAFANWTGRNAYSRLLDGFAELYSRYPPSFTRSA